MRLFETHKLSVFIGLQELARLLFTETVSHQSSTSPCKLAMPNMGEYIILLLFHVLYVYLTFTC